LRSTELLLEVLDLLLGVCEFAFQLLDIRMSGLLDGMEGPDMGFIV
jgi:hypothetical protein